MKAITSLKESSMLFFIQGSKQIAPAPSLVVSWDNARASWINENDVSAPSPNSFVGGIGAIFCDSNCMNLFIL